MLMIPRRTAAYFLLGTVLILACNSGVVHSDDPDGSGNPGSGAGKEIVFRVQVSKAGLQSSSLVQGKKPNVWVEVRLSGELFNPPLEILPIEKSAASWKTPLEAAKSDFSAFKADDKDWILENFAGEDRESVESFLNNAAMRERNRKTFEAKEFREIKGFCEHNGYVIVMARENGEPRFSPLTFKKSAEGWKRTDELAADEVFDMVFSALMNGGEVKGGEAP
ncbi:MAG: hypothetical protein V3U53_04190 [bacterium]